MGRACYLRGKSQSTIFLKNCKNDNMRPGKLLVMQNEYASYRLAFSEDNNFENSYSIIQTTNIFA